MCYYKLLKKTTIGRYTYVMLMGVRPEKREANENSNQKRRIFWIYIYVKWTDNTMRDENQQWRRADTGRETP